MGVGWGGVFPRAIGAQADALRVRASGEIGRVATLRGRGTAEIYLVDDGRSGSGEKGEFNAATFVQTVFVPWMRQLDEG